MPDPLKRLAIAGDIVVDWNLARSEISRSAALWEPDYEVRAYAQVGGAALIDAILRGAFGWSSHQVDLVGPMPPNPDDLLDPRRGEFHRSFSMCSKPDKIWQIESFLGVDKARSASTLMPPAKQRVDLLLLDDSNAGFRERFETEWPAEVPRPKDDGGWILLKWARPDFREIKKNPLWCRLQERDYKSKLIVLLTANDLRLTELQISRELSWEQTAQDVMRVIKDSRDLSQCAAVVVSFYVAGAVIWWNGGTSRKCELYYDAHGVEGEWFASHPGKMAGYTQCMAAGIAYSLTDQGVNLGTLGNGVRCGLAASRELHLHGFDAETVAGKTLPERLAFPTRLIAEQIHDPNRAEHERADQFDCTQIELRDDWDIASSRDANLLASKIIKYGPRHALKGMPVCRFENLITIDRRETEGLRSISGLIAEYARDRSLSRPLSLAVFGSPGSGKSFAVSQVIEALRMQPEFKEVLGKKEEQREFNLSQFRNSDDLLGALHQIRDVALSGRIPLVFSDEFDTQMDGVALGWLRYFLAPMQDGKFQEQRLTHLTGRAVFVFAGGTSSSMADFQKAATDNIGAKGPDFLSRLKGFIDIPNLDHPEEDNVKIRRAILFRSMLERRKVEQLFRAVDGHQVVDVDEAVQRAFLNVGRYKYSARSMESIIAMSLLDGKRLFEQSSLPPRRLLDIHVDATDFLWRLRP
jgi:hypothetical protein